MSYDHQALADRQEITEQIYRYCRSVDRLDVPLGRSVFHEDATADYGDIYQGSGRGVIDHICAQHLGALAHSHQVSNILIDVDGDRAGSEAYVAAHIRIQQGDQLMQIGVWSRYIDQWSKRDGKWAIDKRVTVYDFDEIRPVTDTGRGRRGTRDQGDPSYQALKART